MASKKTKEIESLSPIQNSSIFKSYGSFRECADKYLTTINAYANEVTRLYNICTKLDNLKEDVFLLTPSDIATRIKEESKYIVDIFNIPIFEDFLNNSILPTIDAQIRMLTQTAITDEESLKKLTLLTKIKAETKSKLPSTQNIIFDYSEVIPNA